MRGVARWLKASWRLMRAPRCCAVSCSQEGEDLLIEQHLVGLRSGFYVDVGAHHPMRLSNTQRFYSRGWRGINIEPNPSALRLFRRHRPRDINLPLAIGLEEGRARYYEYAEPALNTLDEGTVARLAEKGIHSTAERWIDVLPLGEVLGRHLPRGQSIHFLNVDAEGRDLEVLRSNDWSRFRPELVLAETRVSGIAELMQDALCREMEANGYRLTSKLHRTAFFVKEQ